MKQDILRKKRVTITPELWSKVEDMREQNYSYGEIGMETGLSVQAIYKRFKRDRIWATEK